MPVVIVGVGALGSNLVFFARNWEQGLRVVDFDRIEQKNILAQFHTRMALRRNKAQALQQAMQGMFGVRIEAVPYRLTPDNAEEILGGAELVIDCTDNAEARRTIQSYVRDNNVPCLHGALSADGSFGRIVWDDSFQIDEEAEEGHATCEDGEALPFFGFAAAHLANVAQRFLQSGKKASYQLGPSSLIRLS